ncbi:3-deoxy-manno-octulosonate cytidylyltransferase [bacterium]|nr:3-deoxy-manno-octulosonate cytidylyltransferase [bacterium]
MKTIGIIPARYASTRLPGKPLADICGKPLIQYVYEQAKKARRLDEVFVATDDERIFKAVEAFGGKAVMTSPFHPSGTDRCAEVVEKMDCQFVINIQGDEPLIPPEVIDKVAEALAEAPPEIPMTSAATLANEEERSNPSVVKVVLDRNNIALYFSRSPIPFIRNPLAPTYRHIGIYGYRKEFLLKFVSFPQTPLELTESLEQLRTLEHGYRIKIVLVDYSPVGVDTTEDLERVRKLLGCK